MPPRDFSTETILTFDNREAQSEWSTVWSTTNVAIMGSGQQAEELRAKGRRRLRFGSLALGALLTMHCRIASSSLTGGFPYFMIVLILAVIVLGNPMRHFEVFLGQWSISGPGRAFRIIPMFDGIGIAMCLNAIVRAIQCCVLAAIAAIYVLHSVHNNKLPFTHCRDHDLNPYEPETFFVIEDSNEDPYLGKEDVKTNYSLQLKFTEKQIELLRQSSPDLRSQRVQQCREVYPGNYPQAQFRTPAYNFFFIEVVRYGLAPYNFALAFSIIAIWVTIWAFMIAEGRMHKRLIWNNVAPAMLALPLCWSVLLIFYVSAHFESSDVVDHANIIGGSKDNLAVFEDALQVALYIHASSIGTELIHGKALNHFAQGHIDPELNSENIWHSVIVLFITCLHSLGVSLCSFADSAHHSTKLAYDIQESVLWTIPLYSTCTAVGDYSHFVSTLIFGGLAVSYGVIAYFFLKTAIHTILEFKVSLVYMEQIVVFILLLVCMLLSLLYGTSGGAAIADGIDMLVTGVAMPFVCLFEVLGLIYIYNNHDFISDINLANEENQTGIRLPWLWKSLPVTIMIALILKCTTISKSGIPVQYLYISLIPLIVIILAIPLRAAYNYYVFTKPN